MAIRGFGDRFVKPPVDLQDSSRVRHLHKLNLTLEGETGALVSDKGLLLLRLPLELGFQQVATPPAFEDLQSWQPDSMSHNFQKSLPGFEQVNDACSS